MSQQFTAVFSGPPQTPSQLLVAVNRQLADLGFRFGNTITRLEPATDVEESISHFGSLVGVVEATRDWGGAELSFQGRSFRISVIVQTWETAFSNCFVIMPFKQFIRVFQEPALDLYYGTLAAVAKACDSNAGFADIDIDLDRFSPEEVRGGIFNNPASPGHPTCLGLISSSNLDADGVRALAKGRFEIQEVSGYWILEEQDYLEVFPDLKA